MSVHSLTAKKIISRVRQVFPDAPESYVMSLLNDALVEAGLYSSNNDLELNKIHRVDFMDDDGDYIKIPRLLDGETLMFDITSESVIEQPD